MIKCVFEKEYLKRLDNIKQWQEIDTFIKESVSQHSYKVLIFCRVLLEDIFGFSGDEKVTSFKLDCVTRAALHDWDEALILRDLSHETKYNDFNGDEIRNSLNRLSHHLAEKEFSEYDYAGFGMSSSSDMMIRNILSPDEGAKLVCKFCDWLTLLFFVIRERRLGNNNLRNSFYLSIQGLNSSWNSLENFLNKEFSEYTRDYTDVYNLIKDLQNEKF